MKVAIEYNYDTEMVLGDYVAGNEEALLNAFENHIDRVLSEAYPGADIQVHEGNGGLSVYDEDGSLSYELTEEVNALIERLWSTFNWANIADYLSEFE